MTWRLQQSIADQIDGRTVVYPQEHSAWSDGGSRPRYVRITHTSSGTRRRFSTRPGPGAGAVLTVNTSFFNIENGVHGDPSTYAETLALAFHWERVWDERKLLAFALGFLAVGVVLFIWFSAGDIGFGIWHADEVTRRTWQVVGLISTAVGGFLWRLDSARR